MCGRFVGTFDAERLRSELIGVIGPLDLDDVVFRSFNVAPTTPVPVLVRERESVRVETMHWGLVPAWAGDTSRSSSMINARIETAGVKPSFRGLLARNRCLIPMNGFYEWARDTPGTPVPHFVSRPDGRLLLVAGLWTRSAVLGGGASVTMLTEESRGALATIHHRAPVMPDDAAARRWLDPAPVALEEFAHAGRVSHRMHRVGTRVNSVRNNDPGLVEEHDGSGGDPSPPTLF